MVVSEAPGIQDQEIDLRPQPGPSCAEPHPIRSPAVPGLWVPDSWRHPRVRVLLLVLFLVTPVSEQIELRF